MPELTLVELMRNPYSRQVLLDLQAERCKRCAQDMRPVTFSLEYGHKIQRLIEAQRNSFLLRVYSICIKLLDFLYRN